MIANDVVRLIPFYLPQFHPIPENDEWWGRGFTEWTFVVSARPLFPGHYQPHLPADLGFYDLRVPETREAQVELAREYGIHGFCYYHYWFNGRRMLERPFSEVLASGCPKLPFCLCWANENWTRVWDGGSKNVLLAQAYDHEDDRRHIESLIPAFRDERYIRIGGRPLFLVYRTELLPDPARTAEIWREATERAGVGDLYLARVERFEKMVPPRTIGFDAAVEFAPDGRYLGGPSGRSRLSSILAKTGLIGRGRIDNHVYDYGELITAMQRIPRTEYTKFRGVTPGWDNSPRRSRGAYIFDGSTPERYGDWLDTVLTETRATLQGDERIVFVNAWNEWGEGNHLEPDQKWGRAYLEATRRALRVSID